MSMLCDYCGRTESCWGGCDLHSKGVRVGDSCKDFLPTVKSVIGDLVEVFQLAVDGKLMSSVMEICRFNGFPQEETKKCQQSVKRYLGKEKPFIEQEQKRRRKKGGGRSVRKTRM